MIKNEGEYCDAEMGCVGEHCCSKAPTNSPTTSKPLNFPSTKPTFIPSKIPSEEPTTASPTNDPTIPAIIVTDSIAFENSSTNKNDTEDMQLLDIVLLLAVSLVILMICLGFLYYCCKPKSDGPECIFCGTYITQKEENPAVVELNQLRNSGRRLSDSFGNIRHSYWDDDGGTLASEEIMGSHYMQGGTEIDSDDLSEDNIPGGGSRIPSSHTQSRYPRKHNSHLHRGVKDVNFDNRSIHKRDRKNRRKHKEKRRTKNNIIHPDYHDSITPEGAVQKGGAFPISDEEDFFPGDDLIEPNNNILKNEILDYVHEGHETRRKPENNQISIVQIEVSQDTNELHVKDEKRIIEPKPAAIIEHQRHILNHISSIESPGSKQFQQNIKQNNTTNVEEDQINNLGDDDYI